MSWLHSSATTPASNGHRPSPAASIRQNGQRAPTYKRPSLSSVAGIPRHDRRWSGRVDLHSAVLTRADLRSADLGSADLSGAFLTGANLFGAYLSGADLEGAYLTGADLTGADLTGANLGGAYLTGAHLSGAYLSGANLIRVRDFTDVQGWPEKEIPVPHGWMVNKRFRLKRARELSEVIVHYL